MRNMGRLMGVGAQRAKRVCIKALHSYSYVVYFGRPGAEVFLGCIGGVFEEGDWDVVCWVGSDLARCHTCIVLIGVDEGGCCWVYCDVAKEG